MEFAAHFVFLRRVAHFADMTKNTKNRGKGKRPASSRYYDTRSASTLACAPMETEVDFTTFALRDMRGCFFSPPTRHNKAK
jgi:hypothetical protein